VVTIDGSQLSDQLGLQLSIDDFVTCYFFSRPMESKKLSKRLNPDHMHSVKGGEVKIPCPLMPLQSAPDSLHYYPPNNGYINV